MTSYLLVIGDREALGWILTSSRMAFPSASRAEVAALRPGDELFLYTTRGCFKNPTRDRGRIIATAKVTSAVERLDQPVHFAGRDFPVGCELAIGRLAPLGEGLELAPLVDSLEVFRTSADSWSIHLRRPLVRLSEEDSGLLRNRLASLQSNEGRAVIDAYARWWQAANQASH